MPVRCPAGLRGVRLESAPRAGSHPRCRRRGAPLARALHLPIADLAFDTFLPALGVRPEAAVLASALLATGSVFVNLFGGMQLEQKRAELAIELERDKTFQTQLRELQGVIARYRGPLLESGIDLEQRLWHLVTDQCFDQRAAGDVHEEVRYLLFTLAQFLGFVEVVRREGPRERPFLQAGNPQGSDTLSTLVEGVRFLLCASPAYLEEWYLEGPEARTHPGARRRMSQEEVITRHRAAEDAGCAFFPEHEPALMRVSRGHQRAIGTLMITTPMGAERHYTMSYGDFHTLLESDPAFARWFEEIEADAIDLATGPGWRGEGPFPVGRWTRVLLLQQLLVELMDLLDPDCVRLPMDRRQRLMPINWGKLPRLTEYQRRLKELGNASDSFGRHTSALDGLRDLIKSPPVEEPPLTSSFRSSVSIDESDSFVARRGGGARAGLTVPELQREEAAEACRAEARAESLEARLVAATEDRPRK